MVFDRFTVAARRVMKLARSECYNFKHGFIGTEHILIGLLEEDQGIAAAVLRPPVEAVGGTAAIRKETKIEPSNTPSPGIIPFSKRAKFVLEAAVEEAAALRHNYIGPEHLLLGLLADTECEAIQILLRLNVDVDLVRTEIYEVLGDAVVQTEVEETPSEAENAKKKTSTRKKSKRALTQFGRDLTQLAEEGKLDPVIGRSDEIERIVQILGPRPLLLSIVACFQLSILHHVTLSGGIYPLLRVPQLHR